MATSLDRLPPELLLRVFLFASQTPPPRILLDLSLVCRTFYDLLVPHNTATDNSVWKAAVETSLHECTPTTLLNDSTYQSFVRRLIALSSSPAPPSTPITFRRFHSEHLNTSTHGPFPLTTAQKLRRRLEKPKSYGKKGGRDYPIHEIHTCPLPPLLPNTKRTFDFVHTCTEASRPHDGYVYMSTSPHSTHFIFSDDPREPFLNTDFHFGRGVLHSGPGYPITIIPDIPADSFETLADHRAWAHQSLHSDPDLVLHPDVDHIFIASATNLTTGNTWDLTPLELPIAPHPDAGINEFRSAGTYLSICDDPGPSSLHSPTLTCVHTSGTYWSHPLRPAPNSTPDNDGLRMTSSTIAFASRRYQTPTGKRAHFKIYLFSTRTGDLIRTLTLPQEGLRGGLDHTDAWCSFAISDTHVLATIGGHNTREKRWQYPELLVWELRGSGTAPSWTARLPKEWSEKEDTYVTVSPDGMRACVAAAWSCGIWDLVTKRCIGVWNVPDGKTIYDVLERRDFGRPDRMMDTSWNGMWVGYRDVREGGEEKQGETVATGVAFFVADVFRELFEYYGKEGGEFNSNPDGGDVAVVEEVQGQEWRVAPEWKVNSDGVWVRTAKSDYRPYHGNLWNTILASSDDVDDLESDGDGADTEWDSDVEGLAGSEEEP